MEKPTSPAVHDALRDKNRRNSILSTLEVESGDFAQTEDFEKAVTALRHRHPGVVLVPPHCR